MVLCCSTQNHFFVKSLILLYLASLSLAVATNQSVRRAIVLEGWCAGTRKFGNNALSQYFAKFDAPLVKGIDMPDGALDKDFVFVERDEFAQGGGRQTV